MDHGYYEISQEPTRHAGWIINYDAPRALHNHRFLDNGSGSPPRIFVSRDCAAIVVSRLPLEEISEAHVMAWRSSFYEISRSTLERRAAQEAGAVPDDAAACMNGLLQTA